MNPRKEIFLHRKNITIFFINYLVTSKNYMVEPDYNITSKNDIVMVTLENNMVTSYSNMVASSNNMMTS